jgi:hypothetical protein
MIGAGAGAVAAIAAVGGFVALSGDDDTGAETTVPEASISADTYASMMNCIESNLFLQPYFDTSSPDSEGFGHCDQARIQLEADGLDGDHVYGVIVDRLTSAGALSAAMQNGTDTPEDHQAFADTGTGLYDELRPLVRTLRGLDPSGGVSFATELGDEVTDATAEASEITYTTIVDDTGVLSVDVPVEWGESDTAPYTIDNATQAGFPWLLGDSAEVPWIKASPSLAQFDATYLTPGLVFMALPPQSSLDETLTAFVPPEGVCTDNGIQDYEDDRFTGRFQTFTDCDGTGTMYVAVAAVPPDDAYTAVVAMTVVSDVDLDVLDQVLATFVVAAS